LLNGHKRFVGEDVLVDPDLEFSTFHKNHLLGWSKEPIGLGQRHKTFEKFE